MWPAVRPYCSSTWSAGPEQPNTSSTPTRLTGVGQTLLRRAHTASPRPPRIRPRQSAPVSHPAPGEEGGSLLAPLLKNRAFQDMVRDTVLEVLRSPEGQKLLEQAVRHQLRNMD